MQTTMLRVGYGRRDCTPELSVPLGGYGNTHLRKNQGYYSRLYTTCIAFTDENDQTLLLFTSDQLRSNGSWTQAVRERITEQTAIPGQHIMLCATHTHSGPDIAAGIDMEHPYFATYVDAFVGAALDALADRAPVQAVSSGKTEIPGMTFVRHYIMEDGEVIGDNFGLAGDRKFAGHTMPADEQMQLVRLVRDGKSDILMVNWQAHPTTGSTSATEMGRLLRPFAGADYVGACREYVEEETGCLFAYFLGAAGNLNSRSRIIEETPTANVFTYGQQLGEHVVSALDAMTETKLGSLKTKQMTYVGKLDHTEDGMVEQARQIRKLWLETNDARACMIAGKPHGIHSAYHAGAIIARSTQGDEISMELNAIALGDLAFITAPYEMFCNNGQYIKRNSPYPTTFVLSCANNGVAYIASKEAFAHGCYEVDNRKFVQGTAEKAADCFVDMLKDLAK